MISKDRYPEHRSLRMFWLHLTRYRDHCRAAVNKAVSFPKTQNDCNFWTSSANGELVWRPSCHLNTGGRKICVQQSKQYTGSNGCHSKGTALGAEVLLTTPCRSQWPRDLRRGLACWDCGIESHRGMDVFILRLLWMVRWRSLRRADHSSREVLLAVVCRYVGSRNLNNETMARVRPQRHRIKKKMDTW